MAGAPPPCWRAMDIIEQVPADLLRLRRDARFTISEMAWRMMISTNLAAETCPGITDNAGATACPPTRCVGCGVRCALPGHRARQPGRARDGPHRRAHPRKYASEGAFGFDPALPPPRQEVLN